MTKLLMWGHHTGQGVLRLHGCVHVSLFARLCSGDAHMGRGDAHISLNWGM
jgi:hypothetical protein